MMKDKRESPRMPRLITDIIINEWLPDFIRRAAGKEVV